MTLFQTNAPKVMALLISTYGLTDVQAAGIVGNLGHESGLIPGIQEIGQIPPNGGLGFAQWTGSRRTEFESYCSAHGLATDSYDANAGFLLYELSGDYAKVIAQVKETTTIPAATFTAEFYYENAGVINEPDREAFANQALSLYRASVTAAGSTLPTASQPPQPTPAAVTPVSSTSAPPAQQAPVTPAPKATQVNAISAITLMISLAQAFAPFFPEIVTDLEQFIADTSKLISDLKTLSTNPAATLADVNTLFNDVKTDVATIAKVVAASKGLSL